MNTLNPYFFLVLIFLFCLTFSCGDENESGYFNVDLQKYSKNDYSIIEGEASQSGDYPAVGAIIGIANMNNGQTMASLVCTGTLVAPDVVVTAGHCTEDPTNGQAQSIDLFFT